MKMITILVVEDDDVDFIQIQRAFKEANVANEIIRAVDGVEAKELIEEGKLPDSFIILLDLNMPRMNGSEFLEWIRNSKYAHIPVVVLTTSSSPSDIEDVYSKFTSGYIVKPLDTKQFVDVAVITNKYWSLCELPKKNENTSS